MISHIEEYAFKRHFVDMFNFWCLLMFGTYCILLKAMIIHLGLSAVFLVLETHAFVANNDRSFRNETTFAGDDSSSGI
jgi:hypothetical protein